MWVFPTFGIPVFGIPDFRIPDFGTESLTSESPPSEFQSNSGSLHIVKVRLRKVHFSGDFLGVFDFLRIACFLEIPLENP